MSILALDLGGKTGWAVSCPRGRDVAAYGTADPFPAGCAPLAHREIFTAWLAHRLDGRGTREAVYEAAPLVSHLLAAQVWAGYRAAPERQCHACATPLTGYPVASVKKRLAGKGNADKPATIRAAQALGFEPSDDNAADATGVPLCRIDRFGKPGGALL